MLLLANIIKKHSVFSHSYVDDTLLYIHLSSDGPISKLVICIDDNPEKLSITRKTYQNIVLLYLKRTLRSWFMHFIVMLSGLPK